MVFFFVAIACAVVTGLAANARGRSFWGWFCIGFLTGIFGLIAVLVMKPITQAEYSAPSLARSEPSSYMRNLGSQPIKPPPRIIRVAGDGDYSLDIVGEASYQDALSHIAGGRTPDGVMRYIGAQVVCENTNPHDENAVKITSEGLTLGYLSPRLAVEWRAALHAQGFHEQVVTVQARISGGWLREGNDDDFEDENEGNFGVKLNAARPFRFTSS